MISSGIYGYPLEDAWRQAIQACQDFETHTVYSIEIVFAVIDRRIIEIGNAVEFMHENQIISKYGNDGITEYELKNVVTEISDDTQMTLFTANGLLFGTTRGMTRGIMGDYESYIQIMYQNWYRTQTETYPIQEDYLCSWLMNIPSLYSRRAPGNTCNCCLLCFEI